ncbi:hypothetical protein BDV12DRAFT_199343 [Aspergillus spectabilis]
MSFENDTKPNQHGLHLQTYSIEPNRPCPHPVNVLFTDPRSTPPPPPPRKVILQTLLADHTSMGVILRTFIYSYISHDIVDPTSPTPEAKNQMSVPCQELDVMVTSVPGYVGNPNPSLPMPSIARVCREARQVVMRVGGEFALDESFNGPKERREVTYPVGFLIPGKLLMYYVGELPWLVTLLDHRYISRGVRVTAARSLSRSSRFQEIGVHWPSDALDFKAAGQDFVEYRPRKQWLFLRELDTLQRIVVVSRSSYIKLRLKIDPN